MPIKPVIKVTDDPKRWQQLVKGLRSELRTLAVLGGVRQSTEPYDGGASLRLIASVHEFGGGPNGQIPERSYLRATADNQQRVYADVLERNIGGYIDSISRGKSPKAASRILIVRLNRLGVKFVGDVQARIRGEIPPPLADSTIRAKGSTTPLIDTSRLINSIDYAVVRLRQGS